MPYKSDAQRRFFHSSGAKKAGLSNEEIAKWDKESKAAKIVKKMCSGGFVNKGVKK
jgi:hypothetical protein